MSTDTSVPAASNSLQNSVLVMPDLLLTILINCLSAAGDSGNVSVGDCVFFLPMVVTELYYALCTHNCWHIDFEGCSYFD